MREMMKGAALAAALTSALAAAGATFAQTATPASSPPEEAGSVIVFPKFLRGTVAVDGVRRPQTEIEVRARCPSGATCPDDEAVKIRFHWVCPGSGELGSKYVCKESDFDVKVTVNAAASFNPEDPKLMGNTVGSVAPCPSGYLIGWVINSDTERPIKYDGLTGSAILRESSGVTHSYEAFVIAAEPSLAARAPIATDIDPRTGTPALVFDGGAGHYQALAGAVPANLEYRKLSGPLSSSGAFLILLTLDVRLNRPNYPTFIDLEFRTGLGARASTSWNFRCWSEIRSPNIDAEFTLAGARARNAVILAGQAVKVPFGGISDIPGPVTLLGLVPTDESSGRWTLDPAYIINRFDSSKPTTILIPSK
jgi:hypothetical protein